MLAAPVRQNIEVLQQIALRVPGPAIISDVGGTKRAMVDAAAVLPPALTFVGGHPLGGAAQGGFASARADLFADRPWIFTPHADAAGTVDKLSRFAAGLGAIPTTMTPAEHDRLMSFLSHLPQLTASALMDVVGEAAQTDRLPLAGQGLVDTTRLASSPAEVWRDVCATNADEIGAALDLLIERLSNIRADLARGEAIDAIFTEAARWRAELMKNRE